MGKQTEHGISWCQFTFNIVEGCQKVSPACANCYAETRDKRIHGGKHWGVNGTRKTMSESYWLQPIKWNLKAAKEGTRYRVFCSSLADVFEDHPIVNEERSKLFALIEMTPHLDWLLLTKRPENILTALEGSNLPNIWLGTTVENQEYADKRIPELLKIPATVRFLSCEPLLGLLNLRPYLSDLQWIIAGGESGINARPSNAWWYRSLRNQCTAYDVPFHFKQWGEFDSSGGRVGKKNAGRLLDGRTHDGLMR